MCIYYTVNRQEGESIRLKLSENSSDGKKKDSTGKKIKENPADRRVYIDESSRKRRKWTEEKEDPPMNNTFK
jgi:hypothetical protein